MTSMTDYKLMYQVAPIILTNGIVGEGGVVNMLALTNPSVTQIGLNGVIPATATMISPLVPSNFLSGAVTLDLDETFGSFTVSPGGSLLMQTVPKYPLADMTMAANAIVRDPITLSLLWDTPMRVPRTLAAVAVTDAWAIKFATMMALKGMLDQHNNLGGTYSVMTPAYTYTDLILTALTDVSRPGNPVPQNAWRFDFERPMVLTEQDVQNDQNLLLKRITAGVLTNGQTSGNQTPTIAQPLEATAASIIAAGASILSGLGL